jgi:malate synthase
MRHASILQSLTALVFLFSTVAAPVAEANFWQERQKAVRSRSADDSPQYAQLPKAVAEITRALPSINAEKARTWSLPSVLQSAGDQSDRAELSALPAWLTSIPSVYGDIRKVDLTPGAGERPLVFLIQDVHEVQSAKQNVSGLLRHLDAQLGARGEGLVVGLEGASGAFDLARFRGFSDKPRSDAAAGILLDRGFVSGAEHFGLTADREPLLWGLEDRALYMENVEAYRAGLPKKLELEKFAAELEHALEPVKERVYSLELWAMEKNLSAFQRGELTLMGYVRYLAGLQAVSASRQPHVKTLLEALDIEERLDFKRIEAERLELIQALTRSLKAADLEALLRRSLAYRMGEISYASYYAYLRDLAGGHGVGLRRFPAFDEYIRYVLLAEKIDSFALFDEVESLKDAAVARLARTPEQKDLFAVTQDLRLLDKLAGHEFGPAEWTRFDARRGEILRLTERAEAAAANVGVSLARPALELSQALPPFEGFYSAAERRNDALVSNLLEKLGEGRRVAAVVAGGFHTPGLEKLFKDRKASVVTFTPKVGKVESGTKYLDVFAMRRTPLEKALLGEKLYISPALALASAQMPGFDWRTLIAERYYAVAQLAGGAGVSEVRERLALDLSDEIVHEGVREWRLRGGEKETSFFAARVVSGAGSQVDRHLAKRGGLLSRWDALDRYETQIGGETYELVTARKTSRVSLALSSAEPEGALGRASLIDGEKRFGRTLGGLAERTVVPVGESGVLGFLALLPAALTGIFTMALLSAGGAALSPTDVAFINGAFLLVLGLYGHIISDWHTRLHKGKRTVGGAPRAFHWLAFVASGIAVFVSPASLFPAVLAYWTAHVAAHLIWNNIVPANRRASVFGGQMLQIQPEILKTHAGIFGDKKVNGRTLHVESTIASLTQAFRGEFRSLLASRARFLKSVREGAAKYAFPEMDQVYTDVDGNEKTARDIAQGLIDNFLRRKTENAWRLNDTTPVDPSLRRPGLQGTGPADDKGMLFGAINTSDYGAVSWMWDWEDAGNDYADKLYRAWSNLAEVLAEGEAGMKFTHPTKRNEDGSSKEYFIKAARKSWVSVFHRVPGIHLRNRQIYFEGEPVPATIAAMVMHIANNFDSQVKAGSGIQFYVPKIETQQEALLIARLLKTLEEKIGAPRGTIKIEMLNERARYAANQHVIMWTLRDWLIGPNVGRWDYLSSIIEMFKDQKGPDGKALVLPDPHTVTMTAPLMVEYTRRNALWAILAGVNELGELVNGMPIGGMAAVMKIPLREIKPGDSPEVRASKERYNAKATEANNTAINGMWFDKLRERLTGLIEIDGREYDAYRQSWVATVDKEYVEAGAEPLQARRDELQSLVDRASHEKGWALTDAQRKTLIDLGLLDARGKVRVHKISAADLTVEKLFSQAAWDKLFEMPTGKRTLLGLRYSMYMASEYGFQQLNGNNAAAIDDFRKDDGTFLLKGARLMNDFATYEIFWHWLKTMVDNEVVLEEGGKLKVRDGNGGIKEIEVAAGAKVTPELMMQIWDDRNIAVDDLFKRVPDNGAFDRSLAPVIMEILRRQLNHHQWIMYGSRVLLAVIEKGPIERAQILDAIFATSREEVVRRVGEGKLPQRALDAYDFVYDTYPDEGPSHGGGMIGGIRSAISALGRWMSSSRFSRLRGSRAWTPTEVYKLLGDVSDSPDLQNYLAQKLYDAMLWAKQNKTFVATGGVMDGTTAAAMAAAGHKALYFSGWQASNHWGQPDLAKYPLSQVPMVIEAIYKHLKNRHDDQALRFKNIADEIEKNFAQMYRAIRESGEDSEGIRAKFVPAFVAAASKDPDIFLNDARDNLKPFLTALFAEIVNQALVERDSTSQERRDALRETALVALKAQLVDYLIPIFADGDTGHQSMEELVRLFVKANAASIHLEDQAHGLKKCGHMAGKVLVSVGEHFRRLQVARKEADRLGSTLMIIARTDAEAAKLLQSNEDPRDHYFIMGSTVEDIPSMAYIIRLARREVDEYDQRVDNKALIAELKKAMPGVKARELEAILSPQTPEQLVDALEAGHPALAAQIREIWRLRGLHQGQRLEANELLRLADRDEVVGDVESIWNSAEAIEFGEARVTLDTVLRDEKGDKLTVRDVLARKPAALKDEVAAMQKLTDVWAGAAKLKTYAQAVSEAIMTSQQGRYAGLEPGKREEIKALWEKATNPLENTLSLDQMKALAKTFGITVAWNWDAARTYEGYYQIDKKLGLLNASVRSRVYARIADVNWMEQEKPDVKQGERFVNNVRSDPKARDPFFAINLSPSFNWSEPDNWKSSLTADQIAGAKAALADPKFLWDTPETWGEHADDVQAMLDAIMTFSAKMGKAGIGFHFVTIFQDHTSTYAVYMVGQQLRIHGAGGFVVNVQQKEQRDRARFVKHQTEAGVTRVDTGEQLVNRGSTATGAGGKDSTENQFGKKGAYHEGPLSGLTKLLANLAPVPGLGLVLDLDRELPQGHPLARRIQEARDANQALAEGRAEDLTVVQKALSEWVGNLEAAGYQAPGLYAAVRDLTERVVLSVIHIVSRAARREITPAETASIVNAIDALSFAGVHAETKGVTALGLEQRIYKGLQYKGLSRDGKSAVIALETPGGVAEVRVEVADGGLIGSLAADDGTHVGATWQGPPADGAAYTIVLQPRVLSNRAELYRALLEDLSEIFLANAAVDASDAHRQVHPAVKRGLSVDLSRQIFRERDYEQLVPVSVPDLLNLLEADRADKRAVDQLAQNVSLLGALAALGDGDLNFVGFNADPADVRKFVALLERTSVSNLPAAEAGAEGLVLEQFKQAYEALRRLSRELDAEYREDPAATRKKYHLRASGLALTAGAAGAASAEFGKAAQGLVARDLLALRDLVSSEDSGAEHRDALNVLSALGSRLSRQDASREDAAAYMNLGDLRGVMAENADYVALIGEGVGRKTMTPAGEVTDATVLVADKSAAALKMALEKLARESAPSTGDKVRRILDNWNSVVVLTMEELSKREGVVLPGNVVDVAKLLGVPEVQSVASPSQLIRILTADPTLWWTKGLPETRQALVEFLLWVTKDVFFKARKGDIEEYLKAVQVLAIQA